MNKHNNNAVCSIKGLTAKQCVLLSSIINEVKSNIEWDDDLQEYRLASENIVMSFDDDDVRALETLNL